MRFKSLILAAIMFTGCGSDHVEHEDKRTKPSPVDEIQRQMLELQAELAGLTQSDYATCGGVLLTAVKNICQIAQAAVAEGNVATRQALGDLVSQLESRIDDAGKDFVKMTSVWKQLYGADFPSTTLPSTPTEAECTTNTGNASVLGCISLHSSDITSIQSSISVLTGTVANTMTTVEVGTENISAGPFYEQLLRLSDQSRINAYVDGLAAVFTVGSNPLNATSASANIVITITAHGLSAGNKIRMEDCDSGKGFTSQHLNGVYTVLAAPAPTANTFAVTLSTTASNSGNFGGSGCIIRKYSGVGTSTIWTSAAASDTVVRTTTSGNKAYNFAICKTASQGKVCYDKTNAAANFATISGGWGGSCAGSGNIACK